MPSSSAFLRLRIVGTSPSFVGLRVLRSRAGAAIHAGHQRPATSRPAYARTSAIEERRIRFAKRGVLALENIANIGIGTVRAGMRQERRLAAADRRVETGNCVADVPVTAAKARSGIVRSCGRTAPGCGGRSP